MQTRGSNLWVAVVLPCLFVLISGCGPVRFEAQADIPKPLIVKVPLVVALHVPTEFTTFTHKEERWGTKWQVLLGKDHAESLNGLLLSMFDRVVKVDNVATAGLQDSSLQAILEPSIDEYSFVTPRDAGSPLYAVSIRYRMSVYMPDGRLADSWTFTGYGSTNSSGLSSQKPLARATSLAVRDAAAKLAVEFREQPMIRDLLPRQDVDTEATPPVVAVPPVPAAIPNPAPAETNASPAAANPNPAAPVATAPPAKMP
jgi:hypothetical protein